MNLRTEKPLNLIVGAGPDLGVALACLHALYRLPLALVPDLHHASELL